MGELLVNGVGSYLDGDITDSDTSITVVDGSVFPATGNFRVRCENELMLCTARASNVLTVTRGEEGTTASAHNGTYSPAAVRVVWSAAGMEQYISENGGGGGGGGGSLVGVGTRLHWNFSVPNNTSTAIEWYDTMFDTDGFITIGTDATLFTVPTGKGGKYLLTCQGQFAGADGTHEEIINVVIGDGNTQQVLLRGVRSAFAGGSVIDGAAVVDLADGDTLKVYAWQNNGAAEAFGGYAGGECIFSLVRLG